MAEEQTDLDAVRAEIDKQLGWTPEEATAVAWDHAVTIALGVVGPILEGWDRRLSDVREEYRKSLESWDRSRTRLDNDRALLLWLHAEAVWWLQLDRDERESAEVLHNWAKRVAYLEARVGELHQKVGDARALAEKRLVAREDWKARCLAAEEECARLRREVVFEACGADTFDGADALAEDATLLAVAEARMAADTGERHSLDDVAREFGVDLSEVDSYADVPVGKRNATLRDTAFAMARQGYSNHAILSNLNHMSEEMGKYTDDNLYRKWTRLLGMIREVRRAGIESGSVFSEGGTPTGGGE